MQRRVSTLLTLACVVGSLTSCDAPSPVGVALQPSLANQADPNAPGSLTATGAGLGRIDLTWTDNSKNETGFQIYRGSGGPSGAFGLLTQTAANTTRYTDAALDAIPQYCYTIQAVAQKQRVIGVSNTACVTPPMKPPAASNADAVPQAGPAIVITWHDNSLNESGFRVETSSAGGPWQTAATLGANITTTQQTVAAEASNCYRVIALNQFGEAAPSNVDCALAPAAPTNLTAQSVHNRSIDVAWTDNSSFEDGYELVRVGPGTSRIVLPLPANTSTFHDAELYVNATYSYQVRAVKDGGYSAYSNVGAATAIAGPPYAPYNVGVIPVSSTTVLVSWSEAETVPEFRVQRSTDGGATWNDAVTSTSTSEYDGGLEAEHSVCYRVAAINEGGDLSPYSNPPVCATPPAGPTNLSAIPGDGTVDLTWTDNSNVEDGYRVYIFDWYYWESYLLAELPRNTQSYQETGLPSGWETTYFVVATRDGGESDQSEYVSATTLGASSSALNAGISGHRVIRRSSQQLPPRKNSPVRKPQRRPGK
jgi:fibronectin type 3 domain-containing protein